MTIQIPPNRTLGVDVSQYQGARLPWKAMREMGVRFSIARAGHGLTLDPSFLENCDGAAEADILPGVYWFLEVDKEPTQQARLCYQTAHEHVVMPPMMDFEDLRHVTPVLAMQRAEVFARECEQLWGKQALLYSYSTFWSVTLKGCSSEYLESLPLAIATYAKAPIVPAPWRERGCVLWQNDGDGGERLPDGRDADFDIFMGTFDRLVAFCQGAPHAGSTDLPPAIPSLADVLRDMDLATLTRATYEEDRAAKEKRVSDEEDAKTREP